MSDAECPYCGADVEINHDDGYGYEEDKMHEQECGACDKTFAFTTSIIFSYNTKQADCLNGAEHNYHPTSTFPVRYTKMECTECWYRREPTPAEMAHIEFIRSKKITPEPEPEGSTRDGK